MKLIDISYSLQQAPLYPESMIPELTKCCERRVGDDYNETIIRASVHTGTHADAFSHFTDSGVGIDKMGLHYYIGWCYVLTLAENSDWQKALMQQIPENCVRILLRSQGQFYCNDELADSLAAKGIITLGTDGVSVGRIDLEIEGHRSLMDRNIAILENLDLSPVVDGWYFLSAAPIKIAESDGSFVRAILMQL